MTKIKVRGFYRDRKIVGSKLKGADWFCLNCNKKELYPILAKLDFINRMLHSDKITKRKSRKLYIKKEETISKLLIYKKDTKAICNTWKDIYGWRGDKANMRIGYRLYCPDCGALIYEFYLPTYPPELCAKF